MRKLFSAFIFILIIISTNAAITSAQCNYEYLFIFYIPWGNPQVLVEKAVASGLSAYATPLYRDANASADFYLYWLITGSRPTLPDFSLHGINISEVNQTRISAIWSNSTLIDIPIVDPSAHGAAINPTINATYALISPKVFEIETNSSVFWDELNTDIGTISLGDELYVVLSSYNLTLVTHNVSLGRTLGPLKLNATKIDQRSGIYYISFYVLDVSGKSVKLLFPGAIRSSGYASRGIGELEGLTTHWHLLLSNIDLARSLPDEVKLWWLDQSINSIQVMLSRAFVDTDNRVYIMYVPNLSLVKLILGEEYMRGFQERLYDLILSTLTKYIALKKPNYLALFLDVNEEAPSIVYASPCLSSSGVVSEVSVSQTIGILFSFSSALPLRNIEGLELASRVKDLEKDVNNVRATVAQLNTTLKNVESRLSKCESERDILQVKLMDVELVRKAAEDMMRTSYMYITGGLLINVAICILLGFLAYRASLKKP
ncbi:MAG: hypothetical protein QXW94_03685 [Desulfurococcaceae archaeon]